MSRFTLPAVAQVPLFRVLLGVFAFQPHGLGLLVAPACDEAYLALAAVCVACMLSILQAMLMVWVC